MSNFPTEQFQELLLRWRDDPVVFVREAFRGDPSFPAPEPEEWQKEALRALRDHDRIAVASGNGVGKTSFLSWAILWLLTTRSEVKIPCTANTGTQLHDVLWSEIGKWHRRMLPLLRNMLVVTSDKVSRAHREDIAFATARTARREQPEAFQGFHSSALVFIADEASGIDDVIFEAGRGGMSTKGAKTLLTGNPTRTQGFFYDVFHPRAGGSEWWTRTVSCMESSQVDQAFIDEMARDYGEESNVYRVRVLGLFPRADEDAVIPLPWLEAARGREVERVLAPVVWGVDVARHGNDRSAVAKRMANHLLEPVESWKNLDLMQTAGRLVAMYEATPKFMRPKEIMVDAIGFGAGVADRLREEGLPAKSIQVSEKPGVFDRYLRMRDELWFKAREWFQEQDVVLPNDPALTAELSAVQYSYTSSGKIRVETKDEMKKRGARSPDLADAFCLTFAASGRWDRGRRGIVPDARALAPRTQSQYNPMRW